MYYFFYNNIEFAYAMIVLSFVFVILPLIGFLMFQRNSYFASLGYGAVIGSLFATIIGVSYLLINALIAVNA